MKQSALTRLEKNFINRGGQRRVTLLPGMDYFHFSGTSVEEKTGLFLGEDYSFCNNLQKASIDAHTHFDVRVSHVGDCVFRNDQQMLAMSWIFEQFPRD